MQTSIVKNYIIVGVVGLTALLAFQNCSNKGVDLVSEFDQQVPQEMMTAASQADPNSQALPTVQVSPGQAVAPVAQATPRPVQAPVVQATPRPVIAPVAQVPRSRENPVPVTTIPTSRENPVPVTTIPTSRQSLVAQAAPTGQGVCIGDLYYALNPYKGREGYVANSQIPFKFSLKTGEIVKDSKCFTAGCTGGSCAATGSTLGVNSIDCKAPRYKGDKGYKLVVKCGTSGDGGGPSPYEIIYNFTQGQYSIEAERCDCGV